MSNPVYEVDEEPYLHVVHEGDYSFDDDAPPPGDEDLPPEFRAAVDHDRVVDVADDAASAEPTGPSGAAPATAVDIPIATDRPALHPDALHGLAGEVVATLLPETEADPVALLFDYLVSFGSAVGAGPHALADSSAHPARLNALLVGGTASGRKGTARSNIARIFDVAAPDWSAGRVMGGLSTGEGLIAAVSDGELDSKTGETVNVVIDKRLLVVEPEFARVLGVAAREGNVLSAVIRDAWDSGRLRVMTRKNPLVATGAHISIIGHITPDELTRRLSDTEVANGFANRFLMAYVKRSKLLPSGGNLEPAVLADLQHKTRTALERARRIGRLTRTAAADQLWDEMYRKVNARDEGGLLGSILARPEPQMLRLSVAYALIDGSNVIDVAHLKAAAAVWRYAEDSARHIFGERVGDPDADRLLEAIEATEDRGLSGEDQAKLFSRHKPAKELDRLRKKLAERVVTVSVPTRGRPLILSFGAKHAAAAVAAVEAGSRGEYRR